MQIRCVEHNQSLSILRVTQHNTVARPVSEEPHDAEILHIHVCRKGNFVVSKERLQDGSPVRFKIEIGGQSDFGTARTGAKERHQVLADLLTVTDHTR